MSPEEAKMQLFKKSFTSMLVDAAYLSEKSLGFTLEIADFQNIFEQGSERIYRSHLAHHRRCDSELRGL